MQAKNLLLTNLKNQMPILSALILSTLFSVALISFRMYYSSFNTYRFLVWNLFLAWIPYGISWLLNLYGHQIKSRTIIAVIIFTWLLFFPNAPYIVTDLFHFYKKPAIPIWFDLVLIVSFAWNGLILGFLSLRDMQNFLAQRSKAIWGWLFSLASLVLGSFGIYLGRYLRWNSWDILTEPLSLFYDITDRILHPMEHPSTIAITILFSGLLIVMYITFNILTNLNQQHNRG